MKHVFLRVSYQLFCAALICWASGLRAQECVECSTLECLTNPTVTIDGNFLVFSSAGGNTGQPQYSAVTGQGGIFVDACGVLNISKQYRADFEAMVVASCNGDVDLPKNQVRFKDGFGIAAWNLNMFSPYQRVIIPADAVISDYTLNWIDIQLDYCVFSPYLLPDANICFCPEVTQENITAIPTIEGRVNQLQIQGSRQGFPAHIKIDGGVVDELIFQPSDYAGSAPVAVVVLQNDGSVGLNMAHPNVDSVYAETTLGINGVTIIANGTGYVKLNEDMIVSNRCAFVAGPDFDPAIHTLYVYSDVQRELRLDGSTTFEVELNGGKLVIGGEIRLIAEPGAKFLFGQGSTLNIANDSVLEFQPYIKAQQDFATTSTNEGTSTTDAFRVKLIGEGSILLTDDALMVADRDAYVGVETYKAGPDDRDFPCEITTTNIVIELRDNSTFELGGDRSPFGGAFQVGNTVPRSTDLLVPHTINFTLRINGVNADFTTHGQAFFGWNVGIVNALGSIPNNWYVTTLNNVVTAAVDLNQGLFSHASIFSGTTPDASLFAVGTALGSVPSYSFNYPPSQSAAQARATNCLVHGGGNFVVVSGTTIQQPVVVITDTPPTAVTTLYTSILAAMPLLDVNAPISVTALDFYAAMKTYEGVLNTPPSRNNAQANTSLETEIANESVNELRVGYIDRGFIGRDSIFNVRDKRGGMMEDILVRAASIGAVTFAVNTQLIAPTFVVTAAQLN